MAVAVHAAPPDLVAGPRQSFLTPDRACLHTGGMPKKTATAAATRISPHQALVYAMLLIAGADRDLKTRELKLMGRKARQLPVFEGFDDAALPDIAQEFAVLVHAKDGVDKALDLIAGALPNHLRETCYLCAAEVAAIDGRVPVEELRVLQRLRVALDLDRLITAALERATQARLATL